MLLLISSLNQAPHLLKEKVAHETVRNLRLGTYALITFVTFGCNTNVPQSPTYSEPPLNIQSVNSPTHGDSREPELNSTADGRIVLSWVENLGNGNLFDEAELDNRVCECCQTSATVTSDGPIAVCLEQDIA